MQPVSTNLDTPAPQTRPPELGRRFWIVWTGQTLSVLGSTVSGVAGAIYVYLETRSLGWLAVLAAVAAVPAVAALPVLGRLDRWPRRTVMLVADGSAAVVTSLALLLAVGGRLEAWHLVVLALASGTANAFQSPAYQAAIPVLAEPGALARANGLVQLGPAVGMVLGPAIASALMVWSGIAGVLVLDLVTFVVAVASTSVVRLPPQPADAAETAGWGPAVRFLLGPGRVLARLIGAIALVNLVLGAYNVVMTALGIELGGPGRVGLVTATGGVAMIAASLAMGARGLPAARGRLLVGALVTMGVATVVAAVRPSFALLVVGVTIALASVPVANAVTGTVFHERVPAHLQGRVFGLRAGIGQGLMPLGSIAVGVVSARILEPGLADGAWLDRSVAHVLGHGVDRAPAVVLAAAGVVLVGLALALHLSRTAEALDAPIDD